MSQRSLLLRAMVVLGMGAYWLVTSPAVASARDVQVCQECVSVCPENSRTWCIDNCPSSSSGTCDIVAEECPDQMALTCTRAD